MNKSTKAGQLRANFLSTREARPQLCTASPEASENSWWISSLLERAARGFEIASFEESTLMMSKTRSNPSATELHARKAATALAKRRVPEMSPDLDQYLEYSPQEIFAALEGAARHMPPAGKDEALALGYLFLLQNLLERLRYRIERGHADAAELVEKFQRDIAARAEAGQIDGHLLLDLARTLHQAKKSRQQRSLPQH